MAKTAAQRKFFHITRADNRREIAAEGLRASSGWASGSGVFVTTNPESWIHLFEPDGVYETDAVDIWSVAVKGYELRPDEHETAEPGEDFFVPHDVPPSRIRLVSTLKRPSSSYAWQRVDEPKTAAQLDAEINEVLGKR